jgi:putative CocE/NonD family hydrolase
MYGFSYQGMTQLYAAVNCPAALKTICPAMIGYDLYHDWAYEGGAFCYQLNLGWAIQLASETTRRKGDLEAYRTLYAAARNLPITDPVEIQSGILRRLAPDSHYDDWIQHSQPDEYWQKLSPQSYMQAVDLPMLHIGGWFDPYLRGTLNLYKAMSKRSQHLQKLIIPPWSHISWSGTVGSQNYGKDAISLIDIIQIKWFNYFLKGQGSEILQEPPISLFEMGSNQWKHLHKWPDPTSKSYYLTSTGLANVQESDGHLVETLSPDPQQDVLVHDPWRSVPSLGGHAAFPGGSFERSSLDNRGDILTYTTAPLVEDLSLLGAILFEGYCVADAASFDVCATLSQVYPDGRVYNFTQGYSRCDDPKLPLRISLQCTCIKIPSGHRLRLSLSGACFPAYSVNSGTLKSPKETKLIDFKIITIKIQSQGKNASRIIVPVG